MLRVETGADHVCRVTLERAEAKNALTVEMRDQLVDAVRSARADADVRALLITGTGDAFCAGMDLGASTVAQAGREGFETRATAEALRVGRFDLLNGNKEFRPVHLAKGGTWKIALFQNTPAAYHMRPELGKQLTEELRAKLHEKPAAE